MYVGLLLASAGIAIALGGWLPWLPLLGLALLLDRAFATAEEAMLAQQFPAAFAQYRHQVRRWL